MSHSCTLCTRGFLSAGALKIHFRTHTGERPFACTVCQKKFSQKGNLKLHLLTHSRIRPFKCNDCGKKFSQKGNLRIHFRTHNGKKPFECVVCGKKFSQHANLATHVGRVHRDKAFECPTGTETFKNPGSLAVHIRSHEMSFKCTECHIVFRQSDQLRSHLYTHLKVTSLTNSGCHGNQRDSGDDDSECIDSEHENDQDNILESNSNKTGAATPFQCTVCLKSFRQRNHLLLHQRTHMSYKNIVGNKNVSTPENHVKQSTGMGENPFSCSHCQKSFRQRNHLLLHQRTHKIEKSLNTPVGCKLALRENPASDSGTHTSKKPFVCTICQKRFLQRNHIRMHLRMHIRAQ